MFKSDKLENKTMNNKNFIVIKNESSVPLNGLAPGDTVRVKTDNVGMPLDSFWRRRLRDAKLDGCVSIVAETKANAKKSSKSKEG